jgi:hypothetical protein
VINKKTKVYFASHAMEEIKKKGETTMKKFR